MLYLTVLLGMFMSPCEKEVLENLKQILSVFLGILNSQNASECRSAKSILLYYFSEIIMMPFYSLQQMGLSKLRS